MFYLKGGMAYTDKICGQRILGRKLLDLPPLHLQREPQAKIAAYKFKIDNGGSVWLEDDRTNKLVEVDKKNYIANMQLDKISNVFDFNILLKVFISEEEEEVPMRGDLFRQNNCV